MSYGLLELCTDARGVCTLTLNDPARRNILSPTMIGELTEAAVRLGQDRSVRAVVLAGAGKVFCAGGDLNWMKDQLGATRAQRIAEARKLARMLDALNSMPKPLIGRIQGGAFGGGVGLACVCDVAIADASAKMAFSEVRLGIIPATIGPYVIARMGEARARRVFMSARIFDAAEAERLGILSRVCGTVAELDAAIDDEVLPYLSVAPGAVGRAKKLARALGPVIDPAIIELTIDQLADAWEDEEAMHGITAFLDKQAPAGPVNRNARSAALTKPSILLLPGDGIGPEVLAEVRKIIDWLGTRGIDFDVLEGLIGGASYDAYGVPLSDETLARAQAVDAVLMGAVGGPKYDGVDYARRPEAGLLRIRKEMDLYANLRPAQCFEALADFSSLKREVVSGLDIVIVRELTSGIYFGEPRGIFDDPEGGRVGINTQRYTTHEIRRIARSAFEMARRRHGRVCSMEKANVMESGVLWREEVQWVHDNEYQDVTLSHMYADNGLMQLVRNPKQFDVIVTDNLFGDLLSDAAAMLTGSLGMLPSASLGAPMPNGRPKALYEPVHGSAPDIAGQGKANPIATILSFAMALRYSFDLGDEASRLERAVKQVLQDNRTADLMGPEGGVPVSTAEMGDAVVTALQVSVL